MNRTALAHNEKTWIKQRRSDKTKKAAIDCIKSSGLFDHSWYLAQVGLNYALDMDAVEHYVEIGSRQGLSPNPLFCPKFYRYINQDLQAVAWDPFHHYITHGAQERRDPHPLFSTTTYLERINDSSISNPLAHYLFEQPQEISPHVLFDADFYQSQYQLEGFRPGNYRSKSGFSGLLIEFIEFGAAARVSPHPLFHIRYYLGKSPEVAHSGENPLIHYLLHGYSNRSSPHPLFCGNFYLWMNPDVHQRHLNPLVHYLNYGEKEGRDPSLLFDVKAYQHKYLSQRPLEGALKHFVTQGYKLAYNPSPWIDMSQVLELAESEQSGPETLIEYFGHKLRAQPSSAISPELYFALEALEDKDTASLEIYLRFNQRKNNTRYKSINTYKALPGKVKGITYYGPFSVISGLGEACRGYVHAMTQANIVCHQIATAVPAYQTQIPVKKSYSRADWPIALAHVNADSTYPFFNTQQGKSFLEHPYRIGFWAWELPSMQREWFTNFASYDEIWVPSTFCKEAVEAMANLSVKRVPHVVERTRTSRTPEEILAFRSQHQIPKDAFVFYYIFDASSYVQRKNPFALIEAFERAFPTHSTAHLLLKINYSNTNRQFQRKLRMHLAKLRPSSYTLIDSVLAQRELDTLICACDCYVSPHRSEGFGLTIAEALLFSRTVIGTNFGGSTDFLTEETGYPIDFRPVEISKDIGPYRKGNIWADPLREHLVETMRAIYASPEKAQTKAQAGRQLIQTQYSSQAVGKVIEGLL